MPESHNPLSPPEHPREKKPYRPILITILCAFLLGAGSCGLFATTFESSSGIATLFGFIFLVCVVALAGGLIWLLVTFLINVNRR